MPLIEIYFSRFIVLNLFPGSGQFVELTSHQTKYRSLCDSCSTLLHLSVLNCWTYLFYLVILNSQILLECSDISIRLIWVPIMYVVIMTYIWLGLS